MVSARSAASAEPGYSEQRCWQAADAGAEMARRMASVGNYRSAFAAVPEQAFMQKRRGQLAGRRERTASHERAGPFCLVFVVSNPTFPCRNGCQMSAGAALDASQNEPIRPWPAVWMCSRPEGRRAPGDQPETGKGHNLYSCALN